MVFDWINLTSFFVRSPKLDCSLHLSSSDSPFSLISSFDFPTSVSNVSGTLLHPLRVPDDQLLMPKGEIISVRSHQIFFKFIFFHFQQLVNLRLNCLLAEVFTVLAKKFGDVKLKPTASLAWLDTWELPLKAVRTKILIPSLTLTQFNGWFVVLKQLKPYMEMQSRRNPYFKW